MSEATEWNQYAGHPLQTWEWGEFKRSTGNDVSRVASFQITWHKISWMPWTIGYLPKSSLPDLSEIKEIEAEAKHKRAILVRMEPDAIRQEGKRWLRSYGEILKPGRRFFTPHTFWLYLDKPEEELLAAMHPKARYNIRLAQKKGVVVKEDNSQEAFERYLDLTFGETTERQKFYAHDREYHRKMWQHMHPSGIAHLFTASYQGKILVAWIIFGWQNKIYYPYGASSVEHRDVQAPSLMLWETARWGKKHGYQIYDLWGAEEGKGFNRFKEQFSPQLVEFIGTHDLVINSFLYPLFRLAEELRWKVLRAIK
jgi:lipid II:glycine glycyltransferase (peptidoglycan interpeptide bridge formation enzyme)